MRITKLHLDGYGRFVGKELALGSGLQIIFGPNERGKSTLRAFIGDMLYGQKRSIHQRRYDDDHELRRPWQPAPRYGGRLIYELDNGTAIEVHRVFDRKEEFIQVFDRTNATDITTEFEQYRNREIGFAATHLGIGKSVFENIANIGHWTLANLGTEDALGDIRDRIVALADSASEKGTAESALKLLDERARAIGRRAGQAKRPLPAAKARLEALEAEWVAASEHARALEERETERVRLADELVRATARRKLIATAMGAAAKQTRAIKLREAERLADEIRVVTQSVFQYRRAADFPLEEVVEAQRAANAVAASRTQLMRATEELETLHAQFNEASARAGGANVDSDREAVSETFEREVSERQGKIDRLTEKLAQSESDLETARKEAESATAPDEPQLDFAALGSDPAATLTELASVFRVAEQSNASALSRASRLRESINELRGRIADYDPRLTAPDTGQPQTEIDELSRVAENAAQTLNGRRKFMRSLLAGTVVGCLLAAAFTALAFTLQNGALILPAVLMGLGGVGAGLSWTYNLAWLARDREVAMDAEHALHTAEAEHAEHENVLQSLRDRAGIETEQDLRDYVQRLEQASETVAEQERELDDANRSAQRAEAELDALCAQHGETLERLGEPVSKNEPVSNSIHRLLGVYQSQQTARANRERAAERVDSLRSSIERTRLELKAIQSEQSAKLVDLREALRNAGFGDEARHFDALDALRAYRQTLAEARERKVRAETLGEHKATKEKQHEEARTSLEQDEAALQKRLEQAGVETLEEWEERAQEAKEYRDARHKEKQLQEKLSVLLGGVELDKLRRQVADDGPMTDEESSIIEEQIAALDIEDESELPAILRAEHDRAAAVADEIQTAHHALQLELTAEAASMRALNEIEEEREEARAQVEMLEFELEAVNHAAAVIDEVARDRHARLAPRMTELAGQYLSAITGGAYGELMLNRELGVSVRVPETARFANEPQQMLSKGTVDQIYLALRLALVRVFSNTGESIPLLLDDPFSNYDDQRMRSAIALLQEVAKTNQVVLFTCRDDVVKAAAEAGIDTMAL